MEKNRIIDKVFREDSRRIIFAIKSAGGPDQDVEDILHQTMLTALEKFDQIREPSKAVQWCIKIAINITYRKHNKDSRMHTVDFSDEESINVLRNQHFYDIDEADLTNADLRLDLKAFMSSLPAKYALPLQLKVMYGLSYKEIAEILEIKEGTVKSRINRAKRLLEENISKSVKKERTL